MADELTKSNSYAIETISDADYAAMIAADSASDDSAQRAASSINEMDLIPRVVISKDDTDISIYVGDTKVWTGKTLTFAVVDTFASRALWKPEGSALESKLPVCQIRYIDPRILARDDDRGVGRWNVNETYPAPGGEDQDLAAGETCAVECKTCPFNQFGSGAEWTGKKTKAKACGEDRNFFLVPLVRGNPIPNSVDDMFYWTRKPEYARSPQNRHPFALFDLKLGSNKDAIEVVGQMALAAKKPLSAMAFTGTVRHEKKGDYEVAIFDIKPAGLVDPAHYVHHMKPAKAEALAFAVRNTTVSGGYVTDDMMPI